jgi:hypothetical protein
MQKHLDAEVSRTAAVVADWRRSVADIETQIHVANRALLEAQKVREDHALKAAIGETAAIAAVKRARSEQHNAEEIIGDLSLSLPQAQAKLADAEKAAGAARHALAKLHAEGLMRKRIDLSGEIDSVVAGLTPLLIEFEKLGREIANTPGILPSNMFGMVNHDDGLRRVRACLPKLFDRIYPNALHDEQKKEALKISEARHWNLPPIESETKAA